MGRRNKRVVGRRVAGWRGEGVAVGSEEPIEQRNCDGRPFCIVIPSLFDATREVRREKPKGSAGIGLHWLFFAVQQLRLRRGGQRQVRAPDLPGVAHELR